MFSKIVSKVLMDKGVLSGHWEEVLFLVFTVLGLVEGDIGKSIKVMDGGGGDGGTGNNVSGAVRDILDRSGRWGILELGGLRSRSNRLEDMGGDIKRAWIVPSVVRTLKDLKNGSSGICNVLLVNIIKGGPGGDRDVGKGGGGDDGGLRRVERHSILN